jgi:quercetin dioxygenase-like cupin family protein
MRDFDPVQHRRSLPTCETVQLRDGRGGNLAGVTGRSGPRAVAFTGHPIGLDEIRMEPGSRFDMHEHQGDHVLYVLEGRGAIWIGGHLYEMTAGDSVFVPAECPHGVSTVEGYDGVFRFLAFGVPHHPLDGDSRMTLVDAQRA